MFKKIEKLDFNYEINLEGIVRNVKSKRVEKTNCNSVKINYKGKVITVSLNKTILELFEKEIIQRYNRIGFKQLSRYIKEIPNNYFINISGDIFNFHNNVTLKKYEDRYGYNYYSLGGKKYKEHRLLAVVYIPNAENKPTVNHINSIRNDNNIDNLEWSDFKEQQKHALHHGSKTSKEVIDHDNDLTFKSIGECAEYHKIDSSNVSRVLNNKRKNIKSKLTNKILNISFKCRDYPEME